MNYLTHKKSILFVFKSAVQKRGSTLSWILYSLLIVAAAVGYYLYRVNQKTEVASKSEVVSSGETLSTPSVKASQEFSNPGTPTSSHPVGLNYKMGVATHFSQKTPRMKHWDADKILPKIVEMGVGWIRDEVLWKEVETVKGQYAIPEVSQKWIDKANALGLKVIICFSDGNPLYADYYDAEGYAKAAAFVAKAFKGRDVVIEILNEPFAWYAKNYNEGVLVGETWYGTKKNSTEDSQWLWRYLTLMNKAADAIQEANPEMKVIGLGNPAPANYKQIRKGISKNVDGITDHPYSFRQTPEILGYREEDRARDGFAVIGSDQTYASYVQKYHDFLKQHNGPRELWFTEWGYSTFRESKKEFLYSGFTPLAQAKYTQRRFLETLALDVEVNIVYAMVDDYYSKGEWNEFDAEDNFGLMKSDLTPKIAYGATQRLAKETVGYTPSHTISYRVNPYSDRSESKPRVWDGKALAALDRIAAYQFKDRNQNPVFALWSMERVTDLNPRAADVEIDVDPAKFKVQVMDLMDGRVYTPKVVAKGNKTIVLETLAVPDHPILIQLKPVAGSSVK